jgi:Flp pilus assembly protein TadG
MVEFAMVFPVLALLVFGGVDVGRAVLAHNAVTNSAREGARFGVTHPTQIQSSDKADPDNVTWHVTNELKNATVPVGQVTIKAYYVKSDGTTLDAVSGRSTYIADPGSYPYLRVDVTYPYTPMTPTVSGLFGSVFNLKASTTMTIE